MFEACVVVEFWPTGFVFTVRVEALTGGIVGFQTVRTEFGKGFTSRAAAERAGLAVASGLGWDSPTVLHA